MCMWLVNLNRASISAHLSLINSYNRIASLTLTHCCCFPYFYLQQALVFSRDTYASKPHKCFEIACALIVCCYD